MFAKTYKLCHDDLLTDNIEKSNDFVNKKIWSKKPDSLGSF